MSDHLPFWGKAHRLRALEASARILADDLESLVHVESTDDSAVVEGNIDDGLRVIADCWRELKAQAGR